MRSYQALILALVLLVTPAIAEGHEKSLDMLMKKINQLREEHNLKPLSVSKELEKASLSHSTEMAAKNFFDHTSPDRSHSTPADRADQAGYYWMEIHENLYRSKKSTVQEAAQAAFEAWNHSSIHKANLLDSSCRHAGLGLAQAKDGRYYFTLMIGDN